MEELDLTLGDERRRAPRPLALPPGLLLKLDFIIKPIMRGLTHPLRGLFLLSLLIVSSCMWVFWTIEYRMAPLQAFHNAVRNESSLIDEIAELKSAQNKEKIATLEQELVAASERILPNYTALAAWLHQRAEDAATAGLKFEYQLFEPNNIDELTRVLRVPVVIALKINTQSADKDGYQRLLAYLYDIDQDPWTKEVKRAAMSAVNGAASILEVSMDLWMHDAPESTGPIGRPDVGSRLSVPALGSALD